MAVNLQNVTLPTGAYTPTQTQQVAVDSATEVVENLLKTPTLPTGTTSHLHCNKLQLMSF